MPRSPLRIVRDSPGFLATVARKPRLAAAVLRHSALARRRRARGLSTPSCLEYAVTYACQARCAHCSATTVPSDARDRLDLSAVSALAREARALGVYEVNLTGGEPTLRRDLLDLVRCFHPERTFIGLNTNGALLDRTRVLALRDAGVDLLKLSLDAADPEEHDANRQLPGNHAHVVDLLHQLRSMWGIRGHVCAVGTSALVRSGGAARLVRLARSLDATIGFTLPVAVGRWSHHDDPLPEADLAALRALCAQPGVFFQGSVGSGDFVCPAGRDDVYVTPDGVVLPCPFLQTPFGDVRAGLEPAFLTMSRAIRAAGDGSLCLAAEAPGALG